MKKATFLGLMLLIVMLTGCSTRQNESTTGTSNDTASSTESSSQNEESSKQPTSSVAAEGDANLKEVTVSAEEAIEIYQEVYPETTVTSLELEKSLGSYYYTVKGMDDSKEYEVKINAKTKESTKEKEELLDVDEQKGVEREAEKLSLEGILSLEEATTKALEAVGKGTATEWSLEKEVVTTYWEVKIMDGRSEVSVKLDAVTGEVLEMEMDDD